jgi:hypothetical protein
MKKPTEDFAVQPHSQGDIYPAIIGYRERYVSEDVARMHADSTSATVTRCPGCALCADPVVSYFLILDGREEEYATHADAESVARAMLADPILRARWSKRDAPVKSAQSPAYGAGFNAYRGDDCF